MSFVLEFTEKTISDINRHKRGGNALILKKIEKLLIELKNHPTVGTGQIEKLKHKNIETWSRRISKEHRLTYVINENTLTVLILSAYGHYT